MKVINSNKFPLPGPNYPRAEHLGTIKDGLREYVVFQILEGKMKGNVYIEEIRGVLLGNNMAANLFFIEDDNLAMELENFARENGILNPIRQVEMRKK
jgi:hypothetical protein